MTRSLVISALILISAALLGWREKVKYASEQETSEKLQKQAAANPSLDPLSPINIERSKADRAKQAKIKRLAMDFFSQSIRAAEDPAATGGEEFQRLEADLKSRLASLDPAGIKQFVEECKNNPDMNFQITESLNRYIREVFIQKEPIEMARMMSQSPKLFDLGVAGIHDPFQYLVYYYSWEKRDLATVFDCLSDAPLELQSRYIGIATSFATDKPSQRAELLEEMRYFATTPEKQELLNAQLSEPVFSRANAKGSFIELSEWIGAVNLSSDELVVATKDMHNKVRVGDTAQWLDWLAKNDMPDDVSKQRAFELASKWTEKDYQAVAQWLNSSTDSPEKAAVASAYAAKTYPYDPENAMKWIQTLPQGADRNKALEAIYQGIRKNENYDREAVEAFAREHGLEE